MYDFCTQTIFSKPYIDFLSFSHTSHLTLSRSRVRVELVELLHVMLRGCILSVSFLFPTASPYLVRISETEVFLNALFDSSLWKLLVLFDLVVRVPQFWMQFRTGVCRVFVSLSLRFWNALRWKWSCLSNLRTSFWSYPRRRRFSNSVILQNDWTFFCYFRRIAKITR